VVARDDTVAFRYRFYFHRGNELEGKVAERFQEYLGSQKP